MNEESDIDFERRFGGIARLYGAKAFERFQQAHVCVIGIGGVGSWAAEALARSAVGEITLIDLDHVAESNTNRQIHALEGEYGKSKVDAMAQRMHAINPRCQLHGVEDFLMEENLQALILDQGYDYIIDCIDSYKTKAALIAFCRRHKIKLITVGGAGGKLDPLRIQQVDLYRTEHDPLLAKTRRLLRRDYNFPRNLKRRFDVPCVYSDEQPRFPNGEGEVCHVKSAGDSSLNCGGYGSATAITATFGFVAVAHVLKKLAAG